MILAVYIVLCGVLLMVPMSSGKEYHVDFTGFCGDFESMRTHDFSSSFYRSMENLLDDINDDLNSQGLFPPNTNHMDYLRDTHCVDPSTYFKPECLYLRRRQIVLNFILDWYVISKHGRAMRGVAVSHDIWLLHPAMIECRKGRSVKNEAKKILLKGLKGKNIADFQDILNKNNRYVIYLKATMKLRKEIEESCGREDSDDIFCPDLLDMVRLVDAYQIVKDGSRSGVKWDAYQLNFAMIQQNNPSQYSSTISSQASKNLILKNLEQIFTYVNKGQVTELRDMMTVVPQKSSSLRCENFLNLPSNTKNRCIFFRVISQIRDYLKSTIPLGNGQVKKILNTNIDYPTFLRLTEMNEILSVVQNQNKALIKLTKWVESEVQKGINTRFNGLRSYFQKVESFNREKSKADVDFIKGRLDDYKTDVATLSNELSTKLAKILKYAIASVSLEIAENAIQVALAGAVLMNPLEKLFGGSSAGAFMDRSATLANTLTDVGRLIRVSRTFEDIRTKTSNISSRFEENGEFLENLKNLILTIGKETTSSSAFNTKRDKFLVDYARYNPKVKRPELTEMTTIYGGLVDACCEVIMSTQTTAAAVPKAYVKSSGLCPKTKAVAAKMFETFAEIYDFQFDLVEAMATYMRAVNAHQAASDIGADYEQLSKNQNQNIVKELNTLTLFAYISYKINIWGISEAYCDILAYKEGGRPPRVCQQKERTLATLASYISPTCRNIEDNKNVPITSANDQGFMDLSDLYAGRDVTFKIPNSQWLVTNKWISAQDKDSTIVVKKFEVFLPTQSTTQRSVRVNAKVTGDNKLSTSSKISYAIVPNKELIFDYNEGTGSEQSCRQTSQVLANPYGASLPKLCRLNVDENNCQELLRKTSLFPSVYSRWKISITGYESAPVPIPRNVDFRLRVGVRLCIQSTRSNDQLTEMTKKENQLKKGRKKLEDKERQSCPKPQYWSMKSGRCVKCPKGSTSELDGYFCVKKTKNG